LENYSYNPNSGNLLTKAGVSLTYDPQISSCPEGVLSKAHAVTGFGSGSYCYDQNGNQVQRKKGSSTYTLGYDAENRPVWKKRGLFLGT
jgi:hypothetical protein